MLAIVKAWLESITLLRLLDWGGTLVLLSAGLYLSRKSRAVILVRGFSVLLVLYLLTRGLPLFHFVIEKVLLASAVMLGILFQPELRGILEYLGRGQLSGDGDPNGDADYLEELIQAVRELSQNRVGALLVIEIDRSIDPRIFTDQGVTLNARVSRELLQTIFQTSTLLHDGAIVMRDNRIKAAGVILPMSERVASRQLGTRHRAAMGISEQTSCLCIVVSEETGSISLAESGRLERPLTSTKLRELLTQKLKPQSLVASDSALEQLRPERMLGLARRLSNLIMTPFQNRLSK